MTTPETYLINLETQVDNIIKSYRELAKSEQEITLENDSLRKQNLALKQELAEVVEKNNKATELLSRIIKKLQDELACQPK